MTRTAKLGVSSALFAVAIGLVVFTVMAFLRTNPPTIDFTQGHKAGQPVDLNVQTVGAIGFGPHPTWVSYLTKTPGGQWVHTTLWDLPAHTKINMTIDEYDSGSPLRNQQIGSIYGVEGNLAQLNGKAISLVNSNAGNGVAHTFSVPELGINIPLYGVNGNAKNFCNSAPCTLSEAHNTIQFSFTTPGPGQYPWQCFVPCGLGFLYGNGGPMQTIGYMDGFLKVVD
ncbi:MAG TPA: hypothetical protein VMU75_07205 [Acidimicrobiales bacterium]|nr:hypothetical protein [Acidimicrobiales bacterium]